MGKILRPSSQQIWRAYRTSGTFHFVSELALVLPGTLAVQRDLICAYRSHTPQRSFPAAKTPTMQTKSPHDFSSSNMLSEDEARQLYRESIHIDSLNISNWGPEIFHAWRKGGITVVSCTCGLWEDFKGTIANIVQWKKWYEEYSDLIMEVTSIEDIYTAKKLNKTGVILNFQNTSGIEDQLDYLRVFRDLNVRQMQLTYNTQNYSGAGYTELRDSGLTGFGREVVDQMADLGIVCDLSHVGHQTTMDTIEYARKPPCFSHVLPSGMKKSGRNKTDEEILALGAKGGMVAASNFGPHMKKGNESTIDDYVEVLEYFIGLVGEDLVGIGSDAWEGHARPSPFLEWCNRDKGYARKMTEWGAAPVVKPLGKLADREELAVAMARRGWSAERMRKVLGLNWLNYYQRIWEN
ncbi:hypothetical protein KL910_004456 [Ogataea haglerorum]|nr:hypothetical protein KL945_004426 [Ogataea haglerorum]KAG7786068.1 hypothetical protein KL910_004456 [Ogataea haglerorum]